MNFAKVVPENILRLMSPEDRKPLGKAGFTAAECEKIYCKNTEKKMHEVFSQWLAYKKIPFIHSRMDRKATTEPGTPDYAVFYHGKAVLIEFKVPGGKTSRDQDAFIENLRNTGTPVFVCNMAGEAIEHVERLLKPRL